MAKKNNISKKLIIFSKAPVNGLVKTRLIPSLGKDKATQLHRYMLNQTVLMACSLENTETELHCTPDTKHDFFKILAGKHNIKLLPQLGSDLGEKMSHAMKAGLDSAQQCIIIGTDCPSMNPAYIEQAFHKLLSNDVVIGPAKDGGYVLIGAQNHNHQMFNDINWSTSEVLKKTVKNLDHLGWKYHKLETLPDVDNHEDLSHLSTQYLHDAFSRDLKR